MLWSCIRSPPCVLFSLEMISQKLLSLPLSGWICMTCIEKFIYSNSHWKVIHFPPKCLHSRNSILLISSVIMWLGNIWLPSFGFGAESLAVQSHSDWKCGLVAVWISDRTVVQNRHKAAAFSTQKQISVNLSTWDPSAVVSIRRKNW